MGVEINNNILKVKSMMKQEAVKALYEIGSELLNQVQRNTRVDTGQLKNSWKLVVDESNLTAIVGSPLANAIYEEFGTGEPAHEGKGRKGGWWIKVGNAQNEISPNVVKKYKWEKVRKDKDGNITFVFTRGKEPTYALTKAFEKVKPKAEKRIAQITKGK